MDTAVLIEPEKLKAMSGEHADHYLAVQAFRAIKEKLEISREKGRGGWNGDSCSNTVLLQMLREHVEKGDMVDVMNLAAMIHVRSEVGLG